MEQRDNISERVYRPPEQTVDNGEEAQRLSQKIKLGKELIVGASESEDDLSVTEIEGETANPLHCKERVEDFAFNHPEESRTSKFFQNKPGRILKPLGRTFQAGGYAAGVAGIGTGLLIGLPGFLLAGAGAGSVKLGDMLVKKSVERRKNVKDDLIGKLGESALLGALSGDIKKWGKGEGNKSLQRLKFEVLESEIIDSTVITPRDKIKLLKMFDGKKVGSKEYKILLNNFEITKGKYADFQKMKKMLPDDVSPEVLKKVKALTTKTDKKDDLNYYGGLIGLIITHGKKEYQEAAEELGNKENFLSYADIFNHLANLELTENDNPERSQANFMQAMLGVLRPKRAGEGSQIEQEIVQATEGEIEWDELMGAGQLQTDDTDPTEIAEETKEPLTAKKKVKLYLSNELEQGVDLHPKESQATKIFQRKPGRVFKLLGQAFQRAGLVGGIMGVGTALLIGLPGVLVAGLGAGSVYLGNKIVKKSKDRRGNVAAQLEVGLTHDDSKLLIDIGKWRRGEGEKSLQRLKFEVLEAEIKNSPDITEKDKKVLLQKFADKKVGSKEYEILLKKFERFKNKHAESQQIMQQMLPDNVDEAVLEKVKDATAHHNKYKNDDEFYGKLVDLIQVHGNDDYKQAADKYMDDENIKTNAEVFEKLTIPLSDDFKQMMRMLPKDKKNEVIDLIYALKDETDNDFYKGLIKLVRQDGTDHAKKALEKYLDVENSVSSQPNLAAFFKIYTEKEEAARQTTILGNVLGLEFDEQKAQ